ncbi:MAG: 3-isopropylmalate dehydratase small subunit [Terricaulis sp.]
MTRALSFIGSVAIPLPLVNIDTDQILPKQFLTTMARDGLGAGLFHDLRFDDRGEPRADFAMNQPAYTGAEILIAGANFGCGSSREHAAWALADFGIKCVIAPSFGEIFRSNCLNNAILPAALSKQEVATLLSQVDSGVFSIDVAAQSVVGPSGEAFSFALSPNEKRKLLNGFDDIALTLRYAAEIGAFENKRGGMRPP